MMVMVADDEVLGDTAAKTREDAASFLDQEEIDEALLAGVRAAPKIDSMLEK